MSNKKDIKKLEEQIERLSEDKVSSNIDSDNICENDQNSVKSEKTKVIEKTEDTFEDVTDDKESNMGSEPLKKELTVLNEEKSNRKKSIIPTIIIILLLLIILFLLAFIFFNKKDFSKDKNSDQLPTEKGLTKSEQKRVVEDYGKALEGIIAVYSQKQNVLLEYEDAIKLVNIEEHKVVCDEHEIYEDGLIYLNKCVVDDYESKHSYGKKQEKKTEVVSNDGINIYVSKEYKKATLNEPRNKDDYDVYSINIDEKYTNLALLSEYSSPYVFYYDEDYDVHMINFETGMEALYPMNYDSIIPIQYENNYDTSYVAILIDNKWGIYNLNTRERVVPHIYDSVSPLLYMGVSGPSVSATCLEYEKIAVVKDGKVGVIKYTDGSDVITPQYQYMLKSGNSYLWAVEENGDGHILDYSGSEYLADQYEKVYGFVDGKYALVKDDGSVKLVKLDGKVLHDYGELELGKLNYSLGYNGALFSFYKNEDDYENCFEITYNVETKEAEAKDFMCGGIAKPILYLYPKKATNVTISFEHPEYLDTTYPRFTGKWEVKAKPNGDLYDKDGKYYYALYWDEHKVHTVDFSNGYYVEAKDAISFLEKKLAYIGLNERESNEFIMYWLPILEKNEKNLVYFELTEERESYNKININPKPDSLLRLVIHIKKVSNKVDIKKQNLARFKRVGFTAVEWGGTTY